MDPTQNNNQYDYPNPYSFLEEPAKSKFNFNKPFSANQKTYKILIILVVLVVVFIIIAIIKSVITNPGINVPSLNQVVYQQQLIYDLTSSYSSQTTNQLNADASYTILGTIETDQAKLLNLLKLNNINVISPTTYQLPSTIQTSLTVAQQSNTLNGIYYGVLSSQLKTYYNTLVSAYNANKNAIIRSYLNQDAQNIKLTYQMLVNNQL